MKPVLGTVLGRVTNTQFAPGVRVRSLATLSDGVFRDGEWVKRRVVKGTLGTVVGQFSDFNIFDVAFDGLPGDEIMSPMGFDICLLGPLECLAEIPSAAD